MAQIVDRPLLIPGKCSGCGAADNSDGRKFVDTGIFIDYYGAVYICVPCILQIVREVDLSLPDNLAELKIKNDYLESKNAHLRNALSALGLIGIGTGSEPLDISVGDKGPEETPGGGKGESKRPAKQSAKSNPGSVRGTNSLEQLLGSNG